MTQQIVQFASQRRTLCALCTCFLVFTLLYVQFFAFPSKLRHIDGAISARNREHQATVQSDDTGQRANGQFHPRQQVVAPKLATFKGPSNARQRAVRDAFLYAWRAYKKSAWGHDQLTPLSHGYQEWMESGLTIVDSLDTLLIMDLKDEFAEAKHWVSTELRFDHDGFVSLFEATIRVLGGLLSAFHLSGEQIFLDKAQEIGQRLFPAISDSPTPVPYSEVNFVSGASYFHSLFKDSSLAAVATLQLEFRDLARSTGNDTYERLSFRTSEHIHMSPCVQSGDGLCGMLLSPRTGEFRDATIITFGGRADSYYEYLLKQWLQTGKTIDWLANDYKQAIESMQKRLWRQTAPNGLYFVGELCGDGEFSPGMDHLVCFLAGILALGTQHGMPSFHSEIARNLSETCHAMYQNPTGLGPEIARFNMTGMEKQSQPMSSEANSTKEQKMPDLYIKDEEAYSVLRPEAFEAWFYMHRLTGDRRYQDWGWAAFEAIEKHAKLPNGDGYASVQNVKRVPVQHRNLMESFFMAESLKYLYLLFSDDQNELPLDQWVFNTEAHPLPIRRD